MDTAELYRARVNFQNAVDAGALMAAKTLAATGSTSRAAAAGEEIFYGNIRNIARMGEWSPEVESCTWQEGHSEPVVGARFDGHNRNPDNGLEWSTHAEISKSEPGVAFHFKALFGDGDYHFANWHYDFEAIDGGTRVTESWEDLRPDEIIAGSAGMSGVEDRATYNTATMSTTLERVAAAVEG